MDISAIDEARFYKRSHRQKIDCLKIAQTYLGHVSTELFYFNNEKIKKLLDDIEIELLAEVSINELKMGKYREIISQINT